MGLPKDSKLRAHFKIETGQRNLITDVAGVKVGHKTVQGKNTNTGVTTILPHSGNLFLDKVMAGVDVINGFGKSVGLMQITELGNIESPIMLTNTLGVGTVLNATIKRMLKENTDIGISTGTVNCVVAECNDGRLNDIRGLHVTEEHALEAWDCTKEEFEEGSVGAGTGTCCMGVKGGIGSASRKLFVDEKEYIIGALVLSNFGQTGDLVIGGKPIISQKEATDKDQDKGSIIIIIATDIPLSERQLKRVCRRATISLGHCGSYLGNGSGDIAIGFTTANRIPHYSKKCILSYGMFLDDKIDQVFKGTIEAVEEAIISSLYHAKTVTGLREKTVHSLLELY